MTDSFVERIKKMNDNDLNKELLSHDINDIGRHIILQEKTQRQLKRPHWTVIPTFFIVLITLLLTILLNYEKIAAVLLKLYSR